MAAVYTERYKRPFKMQMQTKQKSTHKKYVSKQKEHVRPAKLNRHALFYAQTEDFLIYPSVIELDINDLQKATNIGGFCILRKQRCPLF